MTSSFNRFEEVIQNKLGEIQNNNKPDYSTQFSSAMSTAIPIWVLLGITEEDYNEKYQATPTTTPQEEPASSGDKEPESKDTEAQDLSGCDELSP